MLQEGAIAAKANYNISMIIFHIYLYKVINKWVHMQLRQFSVMKAEGGDQAHAKHKDCQSIVQSYVASLTNPFPGTLNN